MNASPTSLRWPHLLAFLVVFAVLQAAYFALRGGSAERLVIHDLVVRPAVAAINLLTPELGAQAQAHRIAAPGGSLAVLPGCEGTESLLLLWAALLVAPLPVRARLTGALIAAGLVFSLNQFRIVGLFYAARVDRALFEYLHGYVAPAIIVVVALAFFLWWQARAGGARV